MSEKTILRRLIDFAENFAYLAQLGVRRELKGGPDTTGVQYNRALARVYKRIAQDLPEVARRQDFIDPVGMYLSMNSASTLEHERVAFTKVLDEMRRLRRLVREARTEVVA